MSGPRHNLPDTPDQAHTGPRIEQGAWGYTQSQAATTEYAPSESMAQASHREHDEDDGRSRVTTYTFASGDTSRFVKRVNNRGFNVLSDTYFLPADEDEHGRLNRQHSAMVVGLRGLFPVPQVVRALLAPQDGENKKIADLGCGTGIWSTDMAREFSHAEVVGVDLAPVSADMEIPSNCRFEIDNINLGLQHHHDAFDVIHARFIGAGIQDFKKTMRDVHQCLKPGGIILWLDGDYDFYGGTDFHYLVPATDDNPEGSWYQRIIYEARRAGAKTGRSDVLGMMKALNEGLWDDEFIDPDTCKTASLYLPIGPWATGKDVNETQQMKYIGSLLRQDTMNIQRAMHSVLLRAGWPQETLDEWSKRTDEELMNNTHKMWVRVMITWGRRRAAPGESAPLLPQLPVTSTEDDSIHMGPYPYMHIYDSKEQSLKEAAARDASKDIPAPPSPSPPPLPASI